MKEISIRVQGRMRPQMASNLVQEACRCEEQVLLRSRKGVVDAKSMMAVLSLGSENDGDVSLLVTGPDEEKTIERLKPAFLTLFKEN